MDDSDVSEYGELDEGSFALHDAAEAGDAALVQQLLQDRTAALAALQDEDEGEEEEEARPSDTPDPILSLKDQFECTPLHVAILHGRVEVVRVLLAANAAAGTACDGCPVLHMAVCTAALPDRRQAALDIFHALLGAGADPFDRDDSGRTALHWVAEQGLQEALPALSAAAEAAAAEVLAANAAAGAAGDGAMDVDGQLRAPAPEPPVLLDMQDKQGDTALHLAARFNHGAVAQHLLQAPASESAQLKNKAGWLPVHLAAYHGSWDSARALLAANPGSAAAKDRKGNTPVVLAKRRGHGAVAELMKSKGASPAAPPAGASGAAGCGSCLLVAPVECGLHHTCPQPILRGMMPPPENTLRLQVLVAPGQGVLRTSEFGALRWVTSVSPSPIADVLRVHDWNYIKNLQAKCMMLRDDPAVVGHLDPDTTLSHHTFQAALRAAGAVCHGVDAVVTGAARHAFCAVRPPGHHAGPRGKVVSRKDPVGSHGFCLLNNIAIAAAYAMNVHRHAGVQRVALLDFDVHHGNGTEACVAATAPRTLKFAYSTPLSDGVQVFHTWQPWLDVDDDDNILFASVQGYGPKVPSHPDVYVYPGSGATHDNLHDKQQEQQLEQAADAARPGSAAAAAAAAAGGDPGAAPAVVAPVVGSGGDALVHAAPVAGAKVDAAQAAPEDPNGEFFDDAEAARDAAGPRIIDVGIGGPGFQPAKWRRAWRDKVLPALVNFNPDLILISAGFDAHRKDDINFRYVGATEADFEWLTDQIVQVANRCCPGRVVSALEGGYNINGGIVSAFARSVAAHVRALAEPHTQKWDALDSQAERELERKHAEERAAKVAARAARAAAAQQRREEEAAAAAGAGGEAGGGGGAADAEAGGGRGKRRRTGPPVDYVALNAQLQAERGEPDGAPPS